MPRYRQGSKVALNVYDGDEPIFQAHDPASAMKLVGLLNAGWRLVGITYDRLSKVFAESERYWGEEDFLEQLEREVWSLLTSPETPLSSPVPEIEPVGAQDPPRTVSGPWAAWNVPVPLVEILDRAAGKTHSAEGSVRSTLAHILNAYDEMLGP